MVYPTDKEECADKLYASIPNISDEFTLDEDSQKCISGGYGRDACTVSTLEDQVVIILPLKV